MCIQVVESACPVRCYWKYIITNLDFELCTRVCILVIGYLGNIIILLTCMGEEKGSTSVFIAVIMGGVHHLLQCVLFNVVGMCRYKPDGYGFFFKWRMHQSM